MKYAGKVALITGASSGIGEALAHEFAKRGAHVVLCARRKERLDTLAAQINAGPTKAIALECDVTKDGDLEGTIEAAKKEFGHVDIVIANAGFGVVGPFHKLTLEDFRRQFETNVFGVLRTAYASLDELRRTRGTFAIIGSVMGYLSTPGSAPYAMSKYSVRALAESLAHELRPQGVRVKYIAPGYVSSEIRTVDNKGVHLAKAHDQIPAWIRVSTTSAARDIVCGLSSVRREVIVTGHGKILVFLARYLPWLVSLILSRTGLRHRREAKA